MRMLLEDVGAKDLGMKLPDRIDQPRVLGGIEPPKVLAIFGGEGDNPGIVEHAEKLGAGGTNKPPADFNFVDAHSFANEEYGLHPKISFRLTACNRAISRSRYHRAFFRSSICAPLSPARQMYFTAFPRLKFIHSVIWMHSTPDGWFL